MSTADWGQTLPLGDGVIGDARPFQARLRSALAQALKVGPQKVKWNAVVGLLEVKAKGEKHPQVYTGMGVILSTSICLNISEDAPWICHCCHCEVEAWDNIDVAHLIPCQSLQKFVAGKDLDQAQMAIWEPVMQKVSRLVRQLLLATPNLAVLQNV